MSNIKIMGLLFSKQNLCTVADNKNESMGESNTVVSAFTMFRHLQQYCSHISKYDKQIEICFEKGENIDREGNKTNAGM